MRTYRIVEDRGCGIVYTTFTGSLKDCKKWLKDNCWYNEHTNDYYSNDPENVIYYVQYKLFMEITVKPTTKFLSRLCVVPMLKLTQNLIKRTKDGKFRNI